MVAEALLALALQTPAFINPTRISFTCPDHAADTEHELDVRDATTNATVATILLGDPAATATGDVIMDVNVQPIKFGNYYFVVRAAAGIFKSADSNRSETFTRAPGAPGKPVIIR